MSGPANCSCTEGVGDDHDHQPAAVFLPRPLLQHLRAQDGQIVEEMSVPLEQRPEHIRHGEADVGVRNVGQLPPLVALPRSGGLMAATSRSASLNSAMTVSFPRIPLPPLRHRFGSMWSLSYSVLDRRYGLLVASALSFYSLVALNAPCRTTDSMTRNRIR